MKIEQARLCLDCDELHDRIVCPACGSESWEYLSRFIPWMLVKVAKNGIEEEDSNG